MVLTMNAQASIVEIFFISLFFLFVPDGHDNIIRDVGHSECVEFIGDGGSFLKPRAVYENRDDYGAVSNPKPGSPTLAQIYKNVNTCGQEGNGKFKPKNWHGSTLYIVNCIDRQAEKWHKENKQTKEDIFS